MSKYIMFFISLAVVFSSCSTSTTLVSGSIAEENKINMLNVQKDMTQDEVLCIMGYPDKNEVESFGDENYDVWYYQTTETFFGQSKLIFRNFTPFIFKDGILRGWGKNYYKYTFDVDNEKNKRLEQDRQKYTNDRNEWPSNSHLIISPINAPKADEKEEKLLDEDSKESLKSQSKPKTSKDLEGPCINRDKSEGYGWWE